MGVLGRLIWLVTLLPLLIAAAPAASPEQAPFEGSLRGQILIASPDMSDPRFAHSVILVVRHNETGAFGLVINRPLSTQSLASFLAEIGSPDPSAEGDLRIFAGGPVELDAAFVLHSTDYHHAETQAIDDRLAMTSSPDVLRDIAHHKGPAKSLFAIGYAGWAPGQLEAELARRDWFTAPADPKLVFDDDRAALWTHAIANRPRDL